jgi:hypothetical protein
MNCTIVVSFSKTVTPIDTFAKSGRVPLSTTPGGTAGCNTGANVYTSDFFSETSFETELNHNWQVHGISIFLVM